MAKIDLQQDRAKRVRSYIREHRTATFRELATRFSCRVADIEDILRPAGKVHDIPCCEAPYCLNDGRFGYGDRIYCRSHRHIGEEHEKASQD